MTHVEHSQKPSPELVDRLWKDSYDMHIHFDPEIGQRRRFDAYGTAFQANEGGMGGIVLKSHYCPTTLVAHTVNLLFPDLRVFGSINIEYGTTGGLGEYTLKAIEDNAKLGAKVIWGPTFDAAYHRKWAKKEGGFTLTESNGKIHPIVADVIELAKKYDMVFATGHVSPDEMAALAEEGAKRGFNKVIATHPLSDWSRPPLTMDELRRIVEAGGYVEHCYRNCLPLLGSVPPKKYVDTVKEFGAEHHILSTDFGQISDTSPAEGMRSAIATLLQLGLTEEEVKLMVKTNPKKLLGIEDNE